MDEKINFKHGVCDMLFFKPTWQSNDLKKAIKAVEKENNQAKLAIIAQKALSISVRLQAVNKLNDQILLESIAKEDPELPVREAAILKLTNQIVLEDIAKNDSKLYARKCAVGKLANKDVLEDIAKNDSSSPVRITAMIQLNDQSMFTHFAKNDSDNSVRIAAIYRLELKNHDALSDIINCTTDYNLCIAAWGRLKHLGVQIDSSIQEKIEKLNLEKCKKEGHVWLYTTGYNGEKLRQTAPCQRCGYVDRDYLISSGWW
ncbi:MAG: hypothetical protein LBU06_03055 [Desulfovibrio sp.]|nr:hypothetical protein [Desulfovibrio sp.]